MRKGLVVLSISIAIVALAALWFSVVSAAPSAPAQLVTLVKDASDTTPNVGDIFAYSLFFAETPELTQSILIRITDPNPAPEYLRIITDSIITGIGRGRAVYSENLDAIVWEGLIFQYGRPFYSFFQVEVTGAPTSVIEAGYPVTNTATMVNLDTMEIVATAQVQVHIMPARIFMPIIFRNYTN